MDEIKNKGLALANVIHAKKYTDDQKDIWADGFAHGHRLGRGLGHGGFGDEIIRKMLAQGYSVEQISKITGAFELYVESLKLEEEINEETGLECIIIRHPDWGYLRGYVVLPKGEEIDLRNNEDIDVHGGITFSDNLKGYNNKFAIGFDCAHGEYFIPLIFVFDCHKAMLNPLDNNFYKESPYLLYGSYKDIEFVTAECKKLAKQLKEYIDGGS